MTPTIASSPSSARVFVARVLLADVHAVAARRGGQVGPVVHDEGDAPVLRDRAQPVRRAADIVVADVLEAQLDAGDVAGIQRNRQRLHEGCGLDPGRRDQIEPAARVVVQALPW